MPPFRRLSWEDQFAQIAELTATRSPCGRLQVGAVLTKSNRVIATGYNGFLPGCPHTSIVRDDHEQATIHAEQNAIIDCARRGQSTEGADCYVTHYPCINCAKTIIAAGVRSVFYLSDYRNDPIANTLFQTAGIRVQKLAPQEIDETPPTQNNPRTQP